MLQVITIQFTINSAEQKQYTFVYVVEQVLTFLICDPIPMEKFDHFLPRLLTLAARQMKAVD